MIRITPSTPVLVAVQPVDFRRQLDGLMAHCRQVLSTDPMSGVLIVFINRSRTMIRGLEQRHPSAQRQLDHQQHPIPYTALGPGQVVGQPRALSAMPISVFMVAIRSYLGIVVSIFVAAPGS